MIIWNVSRLWKGEPVNPGQQVEGSDKELKALVDCGQASDTEQQELSAEVSIEAEEIPDDNDTKATIIGYLDANGIDYHSSMTKAELLDLLQE